MGALSTFLEKQLPSDRAQSMDMTTADDFTISCSRCGAGRGGKEREGGHESVAEVVASVRPRPPKLGPGPLCTPQPFTAASSPLRN